MSNLKRVIELKRTCKGYHWYYADEPKPDPNGFRKKGRGRAVVCYETGEVLESISAAARSIGTDASYLKCKIEMKKAYKGYHWRYVSADEAAKPPLQDLQTPTPETPENACHDKLSNSEQMFSRTLTEATDASNTTSASAARRITSVGGVKMPTADERREVAARLREYAYLDHTSLPWYLLKAVHGNFSHIDEPSDGETFSRLADLIEPERGDVRLPDRHAGAELRRTHE